MREIPYICFFILVLSVMCVACHLRVRMVARAIRERWAERTRAARELQDTILQTVQGSRFVADEALQRSDDSDHMRLTLEKLSGWLGQATRDAQAALNALSIPTTETSDQESKSTKN